MKTGNFIRIGIIIATISLTIYAGYFVDKFVFWYLKSFGIIGG